MIDGAHVILYSTDPDADRAALRDVLGFPHVDVGGGGLIFGLPPAEVAVHPSDGPPSHELYLMCDDVEATIADLDGTGIEVTKPVENAGWGLLTAIRLPGGSELGLYQPRHERPPQA
jgi:predicted enzyme related to lactoylglutathione lyase